MSKKKKPTLVKGKRVFLRYPKKVDAKEFIASSKSSVALHKGLVNPPKDIDSFLAYIEKNDSESNENLLICENNNGVILGAINFSQIFYGGFKNAYLGYYLFLDFVGNGFMTEALKLALKYGFISLNLHRLEANIQPNNTSSIKLVKKCGFTKEGYSRKYLKIGGKWRDHERWAIIKEDWKKTK